MLPLRSVMRLKVPVSGSIVNLVSFIVLILIAWLDYITGYEFGFFIFYFIPVSISAWFCGKRSGIAIGCASAVFWFLSDKFTHHPYSKAYFIYWEMFMRLVSFLTTALTIARIRTMLINEEYLNAELQRALREINELRGSVPYDRLQTDRGEENN